MTNLRRYDSLGLKLPGFDLDLACQYNPMLVRLERLFSITIALLVLIYIQRVQRGVQEVCSGCKLQAITNNVWIP